METSHIAVAGVAKAPSGAARVGAGGAPRRPGVQRWLLHDSPYLAMLVLESVGIVLRLPVIYWVVITPVFAGISIFEGWRHFGDKAGSIGFMARQALDWCALLLAIFLLSNSGVQGVMNANATSLAMMILLALGTFVAGVQARVWQICAVGGVLFLAAPGLGWLDQSPLLLMAGACAVVALAGLAWWFTVGRQDDSGVVQPPA
jgi:hypothetical protein